MSILTVSEVTRYIKNLFECDRCLSGLFVRGEISNFKRHSSGHCYFTLKDSDAMIKAVMFKSRAQYLKFDPRDGVKVIAGGHIAIFERDGQYQLYVDQLVPAGLGELGLAFEQLKAKLSAEGLFDEAKKQPLPFLPKAIGVVTSPTGAALRDIVTVATRRHPGIALTLYPVQVQGSEAPEQIAHAIGVFNQLCNVDVLIVGRGGGSLEELWAFNDEKVARAIASSTIPIVSAVGHETDFTLADFAADRRAATPSQAAEIVVPDVKEIQRYVQTLQDMLKNNALNYIKSRRQQVENYQQSRALTRRPAELLEAKQQLLDIQMQRLEQAVSQRLNDKQQQFKLAAEKLSMLNPLAVLARGYSITRKLDKQVLRKPQETRNGEILEVVLQYGSLEVQVVKGGGTIDE